MSQFSALFQPGKISELEVVNRLLMAPMGTGLSDEEGNTTDRMLDYYGARARGGVGMIVSQCASVSLDATTPYTLAAYDDSIVLEGDHVRGPFTGRALPAACVPGGIGGDEGLGKNNELCPVLTRLLDYVADLLQGTLLVHEYRGCLGQRYLYLVPATEKLFLFHGKVCTSGR